MNDLPRAAPSPSTGNSDLPTPAESNLAAPRAAYVHVPFCAHRCGYCNFTLVAGRDDLIEPYLAAIERELHSLGGPHAVDTLFIGGGTPTHLPPAALERLLSAVLAAFRPVPQAEFSVEANPIDVDRQRLAILAARQVTRISLGAQSFDSDKLRLLERDHSAQIIRRAFELSREYLPVVAVDLIFGAPGETPDVWSRDLDELLALAPDHVSTYGLTFERGTRFWGRRSRGDLVPLDEEAERTLYASAIDRLTAAGYEHYEVSNFARSGYRCRHNETYWAGESYWGVGPGAARYVEGRREINHQSTTAYLRRVLAGQSPVAHSEALPPEDRARELLVLGLRRLQGVERQAFHRRSGFELDALLGEQLASLCEHGLLADDGASVRLTRAGLYVSDAIWPRVLRA